MARQALEIPTVNTAAYVVLDPNGTCSTARVLVGAVSWKPVILDLKTLAGLPLSEKTLRESVQAIRAQVEPMSDVRGTAAYKREMAVEFSARALIRAWKRAQKSNG